MDALSDVLRVAHLTGGVFLHAEFFAPWCIATRVGPEHCAPGLGTDRWLRSAITDQPSNTGNYLPPLCY